MCAPFQVRKLSKPSSSTYYGFFVNKLVYKVNSVYKRKLYEKETENFSPIMKRHNTVNHFWFTTGINYRRFKTISFTRVVNSLFFKSITVHVKTYFHNHCGDVTTNKQTSVTERIGKTQLSWHLCCSKLNNDFCLLLTMYLELRHKLS